MAPKDVLFIGGDVERSASVKVRCRDVAQRLGVDACFDVRKADDIPRRYKAFVCVKASLDTMALESLSKRGLIVWDILDDVPKETRVGMYIASTKAAKSRMTDLGEIVVIPHHHCNVEGIPNAPFNRTVGYVGSEHWHPTELAVRHERYFVHGWSRERVAAAYREIGIGLNLRRTTEVPAEFVKSPSDIPPVRSLHIEINSGLKLLNCAGFGIPSVSAREPAYLELAPSCTVFSDIANCSAAIKRLETDDELYTRLRTECLATGHLFHITEIKRKYEDFITRTL